MSVRVIPKHEELYRELFKILILDTSRKILIAIGIGILELTEF